MKKYGLLITLALLSISCKGQGNETKKVETKENEKSIVEEPKGNWKVDKEFDKNGNLIRYDSIYSWSSESEFDDLSSFDRDSLIQSFKLRFFTDFSEFENEGFKAVFSQDSLFRKHIFNDNFFENNFGKDLMDIEKIRQQMIARQQQILEKYQLEFSKPEEGN